MLRGGFAAWTLALQNRQVVVGHLQDDERHGAAIVGAHEAGLPGAVGALGAEEFVANGGVPVAPVLSAGDPHGLDGVVMPVVVVHTHFAAEHAAAASAGLEVLEVIESLGDFLAVVDAGTVESDDAGGRAGETRAAAKRLIAEAPRVRVLAALDVIDAFVAHLDGHGDAG